MIAPATEAIQSEFEKNNLNCITEEHESSSLVRIALTTKTAEIRTVFISQTDRDETSMRIYNIIKYPPEKEDAVIDALSECNVQYRFLRFIADTNAHVVNAAYDFPLKTDDIGEAALEMLMRAAQIVETCYPEIMRRLYGE